MTTQLSGQFQLFAAIEGTALPPATTEVASFSDPNLTDTAGDFTATIVWGDGNTSTGTVSGSNGSFTVDGGNTYESEGFFNATVTIVRNADNSQLALGGAVEVTGDDQLTGSSGLTFTGAPNQPLTNVTVATFTNTNTVTPANDFTTEIDWGDGTNVRWCVDGLQRIVHRLRLAHLRGRRRLHHHHLYGRHHSGRCDRHCDDAGGYRLRRQ